MPKQLTDRELQLLEKNHSTGFRLLKIIH